MAREQRPEALAERASAAVAATSDLELSLSGSPAGEPARVDAFIGRVLGERYRVVERLAEGGMGAVFAAEHLTLGKRVALKVIRSELSDNAQVVARFAREAMTTARFEHPHIASAIDYGALPEGGAYFVMQLVSGRSLRRILAEEGRMSWRRVCELGAQVADALCAAQTFGIIHRDLKPDNILVELRQDGSELVKVLDFGIAHVAASELLPGAPPSHGQLTHEGLVIGTIGYMAPEQATAGRVDHRTDLYTLGVVLWQCITGTPLWRGADYASVVREQFSTPVPRLRSLGIDPSLPAALDDLVQRLTARAPEERPDHAAQVRDALRAIARTSPSPVGWLRALRRASAARTSAEPIGGLGGPAPASAPGSRFGWLAGLSRAVARVVAVLGGPLGALWRASARIAVSPASWLRGLRPATASRESAQGLASQPRRRLRVGLIGAPLGRLGQRVRAGVGRARGAAWLRPTRIKLVCAAIAAACALALVARMRPAPAPGKHALPSATVEGFLGRLKLVPEASLPEELSSATEALSDSNGRARRSAAETILQYSPASRVPAGLRRVAELEVARTCANRKRVLGQMRAEPDATYLPALRRLDQAPRRGCGFLNMSDCYACIRSDLRQTLAVLQP